MIHVLFTVLPTGWQNPMSKKSPNLALALPKCRHCGRYWRPPQSVHSYLGYCNRCRDQRRQTASAGHSLKRITAADLSGKYLLPTKLRRGQPAK
jgi:hypothetical protein